MPTRRRLERAIGEIVPDLGGHDIYLVLHYQSLALMVEGQQLAADLDAIDQDVERTLGLGRIEGTGRVRHPAHQPENEGGKAEAADKRKGREDRHGGLGHGLMGGVSHRTRGDARSLGRQSAKAFRGVPPAPESV